MPLPTDVEARLLSNLVTMALQAHNRLNPWVVELRELERSAAENAAASVMQAAHRGSKARKQKTFFQMKTSTTHTKDLESRVERMEAEIAELKAALKQHQQHGVLNYGLASNS